MSDTFRIVTAGWGDEAISDALRILTCALRHKHPDAHAGGGLLGGEYGYGVHFENDVFLMHPYCWCERSDCLWCGAGCSGNFGDPEHASDCYDTRRKALRAKYGTREDWDGVVFYSVPFGHKLYERDVRALCKTLGQTYPSGSEVHCTCGALDESRRRYNACGCDWHLGKGVFRFGPAASAPNFWHKPSDLRVTWYKWIGRSTEINRKRIDCGGILRDCLGSIGMTLEEAETLYSESEE